MRGPMCLPIPFSKSGKPAKGSIWNIPRGSTPPNVRTAMNTIPTTFKDTPSYTVVGGMERQGSTGLSAVILNRGGPFPRAKFFDDLEKAGFDYVVSVEGNRRRFDLDGLSSAYPFARFILSAEELSRGEEINIAARELAGPFFLVLWNDLRIMRGGAERIMERCMESSKGLKDPRLCTVPVIQDGRLQTMPTLIAPAAIKGRVKTIPLMPVREGQSSLYPFEGIGIYDRERFLRLGGFDKSLFSFYWQLMDFGFRSHLWGEEIVVNTGIKFSYEGTITPEDETTEESFRRFYLKNLAPVFRGDHADLPLRRFPGFFLGLRLDILSAWEEFSQARSWVKTNRYRFHCDARTVAELWRDEQGGEAKVS